jgi:hypothetical protein
MRGGDGGGGEPVTINLHTSGNDIVNDMKLTKKINQAGGKREIHFRLSMNSLTSMLHE